MTGAVERFEREYQAYHALSADRRKRQVKMLRALEDHAGKPLLEIGSEELAAWLTDLRASGLHANTVRGKANMVRPFFAWGFEAKLISAETLMAIQAVKNPNGSSGRSTPKPYSTKDLGRFRQGLEIAYPLLSPHQMGYWKAGHSRYRRVAKHAQRLQIDAIVSLALYCGLRRAEIYGLSIDDMHPENAYIVVHGKGDKPREVPHTRRSREAIATWLDWREQMGPEHERPWLSLAANQPAGGWLKPMRYARYEKLLHGVPGVRGPNGEHEWRLHRFRHTAATNWLRAGMELQTLSRLLGHSNVQQTLMYAEIVRDDIQRAVEKNEQRFEEQIDGD